MNATGGLGDRERLRLLYELAVAFVSRTDVDSLLRLVIERCREVLDAEGAAVLVVDPASGDLRFPFVAQGDPRVSDLLSGMRVPPGRGIAGRVLSSGVPERIDDAELDPDFFVGIDRGTGFRTRNMIIAPLTRPEGPIGVIEVVNRRSGPFDDEDLGFLATLGASVAVAIENARLYGRLRDETERLHEEVGALRRDLARSDRFEEIVGSSAAMEEVFRLMDSAACSPIAVLVEGETGTGKELVARGIHRAGARGGGPFLAVNCAALPETLLESELFGHRRGAFTGATKDRRGLFEVAAGGTVFLDEIGEMPPSMQVKLLRVLQEGEVIPLGDSRPRKVDVRIISATNRDLLEEIAGGRFRDDLYFRVAAFPLRLPPLRERRDDVPALAAHFLQAAAKRHGRPAPRLDPGALDLLVEYAWPGNARELQNEIERAVAVSAGEEAILPRHLSRRVASGAGPANWLAAAAESPVPRALPEARSAGAAGGLSLRRARESFEAAYIRRVLDAEGGNVSRAATKLGLSRAMLHKKIRQMDIRNLRRARGRGDATPRGGASIPE